MMRRSTVALAVLALLGLVTAGCGGDGGGGDGNQPPNNNAAGTGSANNAAGTNGGGSGIGSNAAGSTGGGNNTGNGTTTCGDFPDGPKSCQAGQYCLDQTFSRCESGCLSDMNCASNQTCQKATGETTGSCQNKPMSTECGPVCDRLLPCEQGITRDMCLQFCAGFNEQCKQCILGANCTAPETCQDLCDL